MVFSTSNNLLSVTKRQYLYKLKSLNNLLYGLMFTQIITVLFTLTGLRKIGIGNGNLQITTTLFSGELVFVCTAIWASVTAIILTTKAYRNMDFTLISNRLSSNLSNIGFLLTASILGAAASSLCSVLIRVVVYVINNRSNIASENFLIAPIELLTGIISAAFYILLFTSIGYLVGMLVQLHKIFIIILPASFISLAAVQNAQPSQVDVISVIERFFVTENVLILFILKVIITAFVFFALGAIISNRMEVRK